MFVLCLHALHLVEVQIPDELFLGFRRRNELPLPTEGPPAVRLVVQHAHQLGLVEGAAVPHPVLDPPPVPLERHLQRRHVLEIHHVSAHSLRAVEPIVIRYGVPTQIELQQHGVLRQRMRELHQHLVVDAVVRHAEIGQRTIGGEGIADTVNTV